MTTIAMNDDQEMNIIQPPRELFEISSSKPREQLLEQRTVVNIFERAEYPETGGVYLYFTGLKYPKKCFPFMDAINAIQMVKRITRLFLAIGWQAIFINSGRIIDEYVRLCDWQLRPIYWKDEKRYCISAGELRKFVENFLINIFSDGIPIAVRFNRAKSMAKIIANIIEWDNAYRYMMQDMMSETNSYRLYKKPRKELKRLAEIFKQRSQSAVSEKIGHGLKIVMMALLIPKVRSAWKEALKQSTFSRLQMDDADAHHTLIMADYNYGGKTLEERLKIYSEAYPDGLPPQLELVQQY
jgi:hypothetical protein